MTLLWKPLLAATLKADADLDALPYPLWGSPKIDGFRCMIQRGRAVSRKGIEFRNTALREWAKGQWRGMEGADGELCIGPPWAADVFNRTQNVINDGGEAAVKEFLKHGFYHVFGLRTGQWNRPVHHMWYDINLLRGLDKVRVVVQTCIEDKAALLAYEAKCLNKGYEGAMLLRADRVSYPQKDGKENRSTLREFNLVKLKRREFGFAVIFDVHHLEHNLNEEKTAAGKRSSRKAGIVVDERCIGSVTLQCPEWGKFDVNVQTKALRERGPIWWLGQRGKRVRYSYQLAGSKDLPRQPQCTFQELLGRGE